MASTVQSRKAKGRRFQQWICELIRSSFGLEEDDVQSRSMGAGGEDIMLSPKARSLFPFSVEAKNQEKLNVWEAFKQAQSNSKDYIPILFIKRNRETPKVVLEAETFIKLLKNAKIENS